MGQLNIKDAALIAEARELAALLGTTATGAMRAAVREKLEKERRGREEAVRVERIQALATRIRENAGGTLMSNAGLDALLYNPRSGLPR